MVHSTLNTESKRTIQKLQTALIYSVFQRRRRTQMSWFSAGFFFTRVIFFQRRKIMGASQALNKAQRIRLPRPTFDLYFLAFFLHQSISKKLMRHRRNVKLLTVVTMCWILRNMMKYALCTHTWTVNHCHLANKHKTSQNIITHNT
jgi:hypothetical protein